MNGKKQNKKIKNSHRIPSLSYNNIKKEIFSSTFSPDTIGDEHIEKKKIRRTFRHQKETSSRAQYLFFLKDRYIQKKGETDEFQTPSFLLTKSVDSIRPVLNLKRVRRGRRTLYIPYPYSEKASRIRGIKWIKEGSEKAQKGKHGTFQKSFGAVLKESMEHGGFAQKKQKELHTLAMKNKSTFRFRWW